MQVEGFAGGGSSQCGPFVPVFSAFGVAAGIADGLAVGLADGLAPGVGAFVFTEGEGWQLLTITVRIKLKIPIGNARFNTRFMGHAPLR